MHMLTLRGVGRKTARLRACEAIPHCPTTLTYRQIAACEQGRTLLRVSDVRRQVVRMWLLTPLLIALLGAVQLAGNSIPGWASDSLSSYSMFIAIVALLKRCALP